MAAVLIALSIVLAVQWLAIVGVSGMQWVRHRQWPSEALPFWFHILLPLAAIITWRLGHWVAG